MSADCDKVRAKASYLANRLVVATTRPDGTIELNQKNLIEFMLRANRFARELELYCGFRDGEREEDSDADPSNNDDNDNCPNGANKLKVKRKTPGFNTSQRLRGLAEIEQKLAEMKGKRVTNIVEARYKKNLKTRLVKQKKKLKRRAEKGGKIKSMNEAKENVGDTFLNRKNSLNTEGKGGIGEKVIFNKEAKMVFNKFDFSGIGKHPKDTKKKNQGKDAKSILNEMKKNHTKLNELENSGEIEKAKEIKEKQLWLSALRKSEGVKVKDDPELLKRTMRKQKEGLNRRKRKWENRVQTVEKMKDERQKKRRENINAKKLEKKKDKMKRSIKKGRIVL